MRGRVLVLAAFVAMAAVPAYLAWTTRVLPGPTQAAAGLGGSAQAVSVVTPLAWPGGPLGLATTGTALLWEQRTAGVRGVSLWSYELASGFTSQLLSRSMMGGTAGPPSATGHLVVWSSSAGGQTAPGVQAYDLDSTRRWQVVWAGLHAIAAGDTVIWVDRGKPAATTSSAAATP